MESENLGTGEENTKLGEDESSREDSQEPVTDSPRPETPKNQDEDDDHPQTIPECPVVTSKENEDPSPIVGGIENDLPTTSSQQIFLYNYNYNQDTTCFSISTSSDFRTFVLTPGGVTEVSRRRVNMMTLPPPPQMSSPSLLTKEASPVNVCSMLFQTNYVALVMKENAYKVLLWDDSLQQSPHEIWSRFEVLNVVLRRDVICVVSEFKIYVYRLGGKFQVLLHLETCSNPKGLCQLSPAGPDWVLACPGNQRGSLRIQIGLDDSVSSTIPAHNNAVAAIGINAYGTMVASASEHGTVVKIFNSADGQILYELRRGTIGTQISSITFRTDNKFVVVGSSNPTVHVFRLDVAGSAVSIGHSAVMARAQKFFGKISQWALSNSPILESVLSIAPPVTSDSTDLLPPALSADQSQTTPIPSRGTSFANSPMPGEKLVPQYFHSFRSFATFRIPEKSAMDLRVIKDSPICGPIVTFSKTKPNHVIIVHFNGLVYEASFDESKIEGSQQECLLLGASAYFQARPDFAIQNHHVSTTTGDEHATLEDSNWLVI